MDLDMDESSTSLSLKFAHSSRLNGTDDGHASQTRFPSDDLREPPTKFRAGSAGATAYAQLAG
ncbi:uncharacterized protein LY79DRAFT_564199 [Colletotrichum navitas]|uniref:Uncharacterized protein n=1 Tax=Colletotrichum navitas TaxID=681940 RepID=A0AAD8V0T9_9PEZI|nr:uncharacterized protein LY79DRAFT_564199 [Colletotrichum navitas]KAK1579456.1 hypothetical protein LY79DRAFT_564199 [Colletotrichum navitas]